MIQTSHKKARDAKDGKDGKSPGQIFNNIKNIFGGLKETSNFLGGVRH